GLRRLLAGLGPLRGAALLLREEEGGEREGAVVLGLLAEEAQQARDPVLAGLAHAVAKDDEGVAQRGREEGAVVAGGGLEPLEVGEGRAGPAEARVGGALEGPGEDAEERVLPRVRHAGERLPPRRRRQQQCHAQGRQANHACFLLLRL